MHVKNQQTEKKLLQCEKSRVRTIIEDAENAGSKVMGYLKGISGLMKLVCTLEFLNRSVSL